MARQNTGDTTALDDLFGPSNGGDAAQGGCRVLVADDAAATRYSICNIVKQMGHQTIEATDGDQVLKLAEAHRPDLIILDIQMPAKNGVEALQELRQNPALAKTPVIMLTSNSDTNTVRKALKEGVDDYLLKPPEAKRLKKRLMKYLG